MFPPYFIISCFDIFFQILRNVFNFMLKRKIVSAFTNLVNFVLKREIVSDFTKLFFINDMEKRD